MKNTRIGLGKGRGVGYYNIAPLDSHIHSLSAKGIVTKSKITKAFCKKNKIPYHKIKLNAYARGDMHLFNLDNEYTIVTHSEGTRNGFRHVAVLMRNGYEVDKATANYLNRTWEEYNFQSVIHKLLDKQTNMPKAKQFRDDIDRKEGYSLNRREKEQEEERKNKLNAKGSFSGKTILEQLGGNKFIAMTGAKNFGQDTKEQSIAFRIGRNAKNVNQVKITLTPMDLYDMEFLSVSVKKDGTVKRKIISKVEGVYNDQLQETFTANTGMHTSLFAKKDWKAIGDGDAFITKDGNKMVHISTVQDRDGKNAFLYTAKVEPYRLALNPKWAKKEYKIAQGRDYKKVRAKAKEYMKIHAKGKMTTAEAKEILGDRARWELVNMRRALNMMPILNTPEETKRLEAVNVMLSKRKLNAKSKEYIKGGLGDGTKNSDFSKRQMKMGAKVEMEHTTNPKIAQEIAHDHLLEHPDYYTQLKIAEKKMRA